MRFNFKWKGLKVAAKSIKQAEAFLCVLETMDMSPNQVKNSGLI